MGKSVMLLVCALVLCMVMVSVIGQMMGTMNVPKLRILIVLQDIFMFIIPAIVTAVIASRYPARLLEVDAFPNWKMILLTVLTVLAAIPAVDYIVKLNEAMSFPAWMADVEQAMRKMEEEANATTQMLINGSSVGSLIMSLLIVAILTGFSEEIFFRGALQRLLTPASGTPHLAIWVTAFIFSAVHFQFYGFVPRMLLGAFFGYLLYWSGSLWLPVIAHALNNSLVVLSTWLVNAGYMENRIDQLGSPSTTWDVALGSAVLVGGLIVLLKREASANQKLKSITNEI